MTSRGSVRQIRPPSTPDASCLTTATSDRCGVADERDASSHDRQRICGWCKGPIRPGCRRDAKFCSKRCRQAHHRFQGGRRLRVASGSPLRFAYADPPYPGMARRYYSEHVDFAGEVDHGELVARLVEEFPDGWALSTSSEALRDVLASCPAEVRVAAWFRGERPTKSYRPLVAWEPVVYLGGRAYVSPLEERRTDALVHVARARTTDPHRVIGSKPAAFCWWLFDLLGALPGDELVDLFPGSGGVARAWSLYSRPPGLESTSHPSRLSGDTRRVVADVHDDTSRSAGRDVSSCAAARSDA